MEHVPMGAYMRRSVNYFYRLWSAGWVMHREKNLNLLILVKNSVFLDV